MSFTTRTLRDTVVNAAGAGGTVTVLVNWDDENSSNNNVLDASGLDGHANGAKLHIKKLWWQVNGGVADDDKNWFFLEFKGASSDTLAINLAGAGHYDGTAGLIKNNATNTTATSGDIEASFRNCSGSLIMELVKDENFTS